MSLMVSVMSPVEEKDTLFLYDHRREYDYQVPLYKLLKTVNGISTVVELNGSEEELKEIAQTILKLFE